MRWEVNGVMDVKELPNICVPETTSDVSELLFRATNVLENLRSDFG